MLPRAPAMIRRDTVRPARARSLACRARRHAHAIASTGMARAQPQRREGAGGWARSALAAPKHLLETLAREPETLGGSRLGATLAEGVLDHAALELFDR